MSVFTDRLQTRDADKAQALGEIAAVLAMIDAMHREPDAWERLCLLRAFNLVSAGCYLLAAYEAREASLKPARAMNEILSEPVLSLCTMEMLFLALQESMGEDVRAYPHLGPLALG